MHRHYATLFDRGYTSKGLALHDSLMRHSSEPFTLHILALDWEAFWILEELNLPYVHAIPHASFESALKLDSVKRSRSWKEWAWTCASSFMEFMMTYPEVDEITYLDADVFFFSDPKQIFDEMANRSIGITPHRFNENTPAHVLGNGRFNVGIVVARNNDVGRLCISRWAAHVRESCTEEICGDQRWLDEWPERYGNAVRILEHQGINLGPWAIGNYDVSYGQYSQQVWIEDVPLVAYHFHEYLNPDKLTNWPLRMIDIALIYKPYNAAWRQASERIKQAEVAISKRRDRQQLQSERA